MLTRIKIDGYKSLRSVETALQPITVLFGPNAAGKSNFLDALNLLAGIVTAPTLNEAFRRQRGDPIEAFSFGPKGVEGVIEERPELRFTVRTELSEAQAKRVVPPSLRGGSGIDGWHRDFEYTAAVRLDDSVLSLMVADKSLVPFGQSKNASLLERIGPYAPPCAGGRLIGDATGIFSSDVFAGALATWSFHHFEPAVMRERCPLEEVRRLGPRGEGLAALLYRLKRAEPAAFEAFHRTLRLVLPAVDAVSVEVASDGRIELTVVKAGVKFSQRVISDGTLRIIGMLAIIHTPEPPMLLGFEEPENGVTPHQLSLIVELFQSLAARGTQVILTTHSPFLPEFFDPESLIVVRRGPAGTTLDPLMKLDAQGRRQEVEQTLMLGEDATPLSERMLRGDFDD